MHNDAPLGLSGVCINARSILRGPNTVRGLLRVNVRPPIRGDTSETALRSSSALPALCAESLRRERRGQGLE